MYIFFQIVFFKVPALCVLQSFLCVSEFFPSSLLVRKYNQLQAICPWFSHYKIWFGFASSSDSFDENCLFVWFLNVLVNKCPKTDIWQLLRAATQRWSGETMTSVSVGHIILTQTQSRGSGSPQGSNSQPPDQELSALPTELTRLLWCYWCIQSLLNYSEIYHS